MNRQHRYLQQIDPNFLPAQGTGRDLQTEESSTSARGNASNLFPGSPPCQAFAKVNDYANAGIKAEQIDRAEGRYGIYPSLSDLIRGRA